MTKHVYALQYDRWLIGIYSTFENAALARDDAAIARKTTKYDELFNITPHLLDDEIVALRNARKPALKVGSEIDG